MGIMRKGLQDLWLYATEDKCFTPVTTVYELTKDKEETIELMSNVVYEEIRQRSSFPQYH